VRRRSGLGILAVVLILAGAGYAIWSWTSPGETPTAASFGFEDWLVRCQAVKQQDGGEKIGCGMSQQILDQNSRRPVLQLHLGRATAGEGYQLVTVLPLGVTVPSGIVIQIGEAKRNVAFTQCLPGGCVAPLPADAAWVDTMKGAKEGRVLVADRTGKTVALPFSLKGFGAAFEKMESQGGIAGGGATWWTSFWNSSGTK
jgi:invasion protein IalB